MENHTFYQKTRNTLELFYLKEVNIRYPAQKEEIKKQRLQI